MDQRYTAWGLLMLLAGSCALSTARENNLTAKVRGGYFLLTSDIMQEVYRHGGADFEVELSSRFHDDLSVWLNFNIFHRDGKELGFCDPHSLHVYPLSAGFLYNIAADAIASPYLGVGASYSFIKLEGEGGKPITVRQFIDQGTWGAVGKGGILFALSEHAFLDLFTDYYYTKSCTDRTSLNVGGIRIGLGLGCNF